MGRAPEPFQGMSLGESLLSPGVTRIFGRPFTGLVVGDLGLGVTSNNPIATSIEAARKAAHDAAEAARAANAPAAEVAAEERRFLPNLARIYGFSYLGNYFKLAEPAVFLVFSPGLPVKSGFATPDAPLGVVGVEFKGEAFTDNVLMWELDQLDVTVRIDVKIGWVKDILLSEMENDNNMTGGDALRRADLVGRAGNLVGRAGNLVGRDR